MLQADSWDYTYDILNLVAHVVILGVFFFSQVVLRCDLFIVVLVF